MKIIRNNVCINMDLSEFLEVLECDLIDDVLMTVVELDEMGAEGVYGMGIEDFEYDDDEDLDDISTIYFLNANGEECDIEDIGMQAKAFLNAQKQTPYSLEDQKVERMLQLFDIEDEDDYI